MQITVSTVIAAPITEVWRAYTSPEDIKQWNAASADWHTTAAAVDLRVGGKFSSRMEARDGSFGFDFEGEYTHVDAPHRLKYRFGERSAAVKPALKEEMVIESEVNPPAEGPVAQKMTP